LIASIVKNSFSEKTFHHLNSGVSTPQMKIGLVRVWVVANIHSAKNAWLEPLRNWIKEAQTLNEIVETTPVPLPKIVRSKNLRLEPFFKKSKNRIYR